MATRIGELSATDSGAVLRFVDTGGRYWTGTLAGVEHRHDLNRRHPAGVSYVRLAHPTDSIVVVAAPGAACELAATTDPGWERITPGGTGAIWRNSSALTPDLAAWSWECMHCRVLIGGTAESRRAAAQHLATHRAVMHTPQSN